MGRQGILPRGTPSPAFPFSPAEVAFARSVSDPERRLAARLAAKRATVRALGGDTVLLDVEVIREPGGAPRLRLSASAERRLHGLGATGALVSLTHGRTHGAASVILLRGTP